MRALTWERKWFVWLVLLRPFIDIFYELRRISPFLSPLIVVGALTPVLILISVQSPRMQKPRSVFQDRCMVLLGLIIASNLLLIGLREFGPDFLRVGMKIMIAPIIYVYLRRFIRDRVDVLGLTVTFFVSTIFPLSQMVYERLIGQIGPGQMARGLMRFEGLYADVLSYSTYINFGYLCAAFIFMYYVEIHRPTRKVIALFAIVFIVAFMAMASIRHAASWIVFAVLTLLMMLFSMNPRRIFAMLMLIVIVGTGGYLGRGMIEDEVFSVFQGETKVLRGEADTERALHGRASIWARYFDRWERAHMVSKLLGSGWYMETRSQAEHTDAQKALIMMAGGMHSDYVRLFFGTGFVGLLCYLFLLLSVGAAALTADRAMKFLMLGVVGSMSLYSVSTTPLMYASANYFPMAIFAYAAFLHERRKYGPAPHEVAMHGWPGGPPPPHAPLSPYAPRPGGG